MLGGSCRPLSGIVGDDIVGFDSGAAEILLEHRARTGRGFARSAGPRNGSPVAAASIPSRTRSTT